MFWKNTSPNFIFVLGLVTGIAFMGLVGFIVLELTLLRQPVELPETADSLSQDTTGSQGQDEKVEPEREAPLPEQPQAVGSLASFEQGEGEICRQDGKPIVRLFSTTWCPHCAWIGETFDSVVKEYVKAGKIVAHHWELDTADDSLTAEVEGQVPATEEAVYRKFNPRGSIPTYIFGCKYFRIGNAHEREQDLEAEAADFRTVIEELLK